MGCGASTKNATSIVVSGGDFTMEQGFLDSDGDGRPEVHLENYTPQPGTQTFTDKPVCLTGVSGFLGGHLLTQLLDGGFQVHGTVRRDLTDPRYACLKKLKGLKLFKADLNDASGWDEAVMGCEYVIHNAGPVTLAVLAEDEDDMVSTHVSGMKNVLAACIRAEVKRVVITSSIASIVNHSEVRDKTFSEKDWNTESVQKGDAYFYAKVSAERAAWDTVEGTRVELTAICPGGIVGPVQDSYTKSLCSAHLVEMMRGTFKGAVVPKIGIPTSDVRDVAKAHLLAMQNEGAAGHRYLCVGHSHWFSDGIETVREYYGGESCPYPLPSFVPPDFVMYVMAFAGVDPGLTTKYLDDYLGTLHKFDNSKILAELGMEFRSYESSWCDQADSLVRYGYAPDLRPHTLPAEPPLRPPSEPESRPKFVVKDKGEGLGGARRTGDPMHHIMLLATPHHERPSPLSRGLRADRVVADSKVAFAAE